MCKKKNEKSFGKKFSIKALRPLAVLNDIHAENIRVFVFDAEESSIFMTPRAIPIANIVKKMKIKMPYPYQKMYFFENRPTGEILL